VGLTPKEINVHMKNLKMWLNQLEALHVLEQFRLK
jgi:hypothetical protein